MDKDNVDKLIDDYADKIIKEFKDEVERIVKVNKNFTSDHYFKLLLDALGWKGGTIHQVIEEVKRLNLKDKDRQYVNYSMIIEVLGLSAVDFYAVLEEIKRLKKVSVNLEEAIKAIDKLKEGK